MPETDINKMKVADLKRELKLRGLATTGNKNELQDRLQTAMLDGEISLDDAAISNEDLLDEDAILTDEDEAKILGDDEHELLSSPTPSPMKALHVEASSTTSASIGAAGTEDDILASPTPDAEAAVSSKMPAKKIVLKRKSITITDVPTVKPVVTSTTATAKPDESAATMEDVIAPKALKMSERNPITIGTKAGSPTPPGKAKALSMQERLELRAKKFGIASNAAATPTPTATAATPAATAKASKAASLEIVKSAPTMSDEKQIELLKKRAERFGCVVSSKIAKIDADEKLKKRQERFGAAAGSAAAVTSTTASGEVDEKLLKRQQRFGLSGNGTVPASAAGASDEWAEKARARLERFKGAASTTTVPTTAKDDTESVSATADDVEPTPPPTAAAAVVASSNGN